MKHGPTAAYTILKNENHNIARWLYYTACYDYRVLLDTGSTDGSLELLLEFQKSDPNLIIKQVEYTDFRFDVARKDNLAMIPEHVKWCLSPDLDEYYSINTVTEMEKIIDAVPDITCISCDRLDLYSPTVRVGPPNFQPTNKIHRHGDYSWKERVYEHLTWIKPGDELELYSDDIFLIHDQDFLESKRSPLYVDLMTKEWNENPLNEWNNWFLLYHYYKSQQLDKYLPVACNFVRYHKSKDKNFQDVYEDLKNLLFHNKDLSPEQRDTIIQALGAHQ
jgi:glycosyltransferase involved in cell wall biosynthesis